ncbi:hypothetical protein MHU86_359 [Fragilaria crotonensis]|nr:hypothetical protein MHU86_359 [Fragilaria crotonensis]
MFGERGLRKRGARFDGPVAIPREDRVQLRTPSVGIDKALKTVPTTPSTTQVAIEHKNAESHQELKLSNPSEAAKSPAWYGQTLEYAAGVFLRMFVLEPIIQDESLGSVPDETTRLLSCYTQGQLLFLKNHAGVVQIGSIERATSRDGPTLATWWEIDKVLPYAEALPWSDWWVERCHFFDPGCEMIKLMGEDGDILGVAYFERSIVDDYGNGNRITLIRGIRVNPKFNFESIRRSNLDRNQPVQPIAYDGVARILLHHIVFASLRFGVQGIATNCPKADSVEDFYEEYMGLPRRVDPVTGRRYYRLDDRIELLQMAFREQMNLVREYKRQMGMASETHEVGDNLDSSEGSNQRELSRALHESESTAGLLVETSVQSVDKGEEGDSDEVCNHELVNGSQYAQDAEQVGNAEDRHAIQAEPLVQADGAKLINAEVKEVRSFKSLSKRLQVDTSDTEANSGGVDKRHKHDTDAMPPRQSGLEEGSGKESERVNAEEKRSESRREPEDASTSERADGQLM